MSRLAEAFRKSSGATPGSSASLSFPAERGVDRDSRISTVIPWDLSDPPAPTIAAPAGLPPKPPLGGDIRPGGLAELSGVSLRELTPLVQRLLQGGAKEDQIRSVLFCSVGSGGSSAEVCAAAAEALANQTSGSVCVVDADLRSASLHGLFGVSAAGGLSDLLLQVGDLRTCLIRVRPNLWLLPAGTCCPEGLRALVAEHVRPVFAKLLATVDYIFVHASAAGSHSDATLLGPLLDGVVLVLEAGGTRREVARRTAEHLQAAHAKVLGAVLTNRTFPIPESVYRRL